MVGIKSELTTVGDPHFTHGMFVLSAGALSSSPQMSLIFVFTASQKASATVNRSRNESKTSQT